MQMNEDSTDKPRRVIVERGIGPQHGYYHNAENGTWMKSEEMDREEAEEKGYSPCTSCFPEVMPDVE